MRCLCLPAFPADSVVQGLQDPSSGRLMQGRRCVCCWVNNSGQTQAAALLFMVMVWQRGYADLGPGSRFPAFYPCDLGEEMEVPRLLQQQVG